MKSLLHPMKYLLLLAVLACVLPAAHAADLSGVWKGSFDFQDQSVATTLKLAVSGATVTGTVEGLPTSPVEIHDGKLDGTTLSFWINNDYEGQAYRLVFQGKVGEEKIDFNFGTDDGSWGTELSVKRDVASPADVTGEWKGSFDLFGADTPITFNLKNAAGVVTGTVINASGKPEQIHDGKLAGDTVTFWLNTEYQGADYTVQYKGKVSAGSIEFDFGVPDGSWSSSVIAKKN